MGAWLTSIPGAVGQFDKSLVPGLAVGPGLTGQQIAAWENQHGVRLPELLRSALSRQDGGFVRGTQFRILALAEITNPDAEFWEWASFDEAEVPDRALVFRFGEDEFGGGYLLNIATHSRRALEEQQVARRADLRPVRIERSGQTASPASRPVR